MSTILSIHFKTRRLEFGLRPGDVARQIGYRSIVGAANKICRFEETGCIHEELLVKVAAVLGVEAAEIERFIEEDRRVYFKAWNAWANEPIRPHLVIKLIPGIFGTNEIPDAILDESRAMEHFASNLARRTEKMVWLVLSRRLSIAFNDDGSQRCVNEATPGQPSGPFIRLKGSRRKFLFGEDCTPQLLKLPHEPNARIPKENEEEDD